jgi:plastocyanin
MILKGLRESLRAGNISITTLLLILSFTTILLATTITANSKPSTQTLITGKIVLVNAIEEDPSNVAVWLEPVGAQRPTGGEQLPPLAIRQENKQFSPHVLIATVGQQVDFPNEDPFPHNVFSNSELKRFDLGIYQASDMRSVLFNRPGIVPIYCNIHPSMEAFIVVIPTTYSGLSNEKGEISIKGVPPGNYRLKVWHERARPEVLEALSKQITISGSGVNLGSIKIDERGYLPLPHKNKEGKDYNPYPDK